jgi:hypothetical protein
MTRYEAAIHALAECKAVDEVKAWVDRSAAMQAYGRMAKDKTLEIDAAEIRIRAERRLGELIIAQKETVGLNQGRAGLAPIAVDNNDRDTRPTLADVGISKDLSSRSQKLAAVPEPEFEAEVEEWRGRVEAEGARVTSRLEKAGERELGKRPRPLPDRGGSSELDQLRRILIERETQIEKLRAQLEEEREAHRETASLFSRTEEENKSFGRVIEADDQVAAAMAEAKRFRELARVVEERNRGLQGQNHALARDAKRWMNKALRLEKQIKGTPGARNEPSDDDLGDLFAEPLPGGC